MQNLYLTQESMNKNNENFIDRIILGFSFIVGISCILVGIGLTIYAFILSSNNPDGIILIYTLSISSILSFALGFISLGIALNSAYRSIFTDKKIRLIQRSLFRQNLNFLEESRQWYMDDPKTLSWKTLKGIEIACELNQPIRKESIITFEEQDRIWKYSLTTLENIFKKGFTWISIGKNARINFSKIFAYLFCYFDRSSGSISRFGDILKKHMAKEEKSDFYYRFNNHKKELCGNLQ